MRTFNIGYLTVFFLLALLAPVCTHAGSTVQLEKRLVDPGNPDISVDGYIEARTGGFIFPDASIQTSAVDTSNLQQRVTGSCAVGSSIASINPDGSVVCEIDDSSGGTVTSVGSGNGITGGPITAAGTLSVDTTTIQSRVFSTCAAEQSIRAINENGTVICEEDDDSGGTVTSVGSGAGLTGGPITSAGTLSVDTSAIQSRVTNSCPVGSSIRVIAANGSVTCETDNVTEGDGLAMRLRELGHLLGKRAVASEPALKALEPIESGNGLFFILDDFSLVGPIYAMWGQEGISELFDFYAVVDVVNPTPLDLITTVGASGRITVPDGAGVREIHGIVSQIGLLGQQGVGLRYVVRLQPPIAKLGLVSDYRTHQNQTVPVVLGNRLFDAGFTDWEDRTLDTYPERDFIMQYAETDFSFLSRLLEEEGIFYFFEENATSATLVFADTNSSMPTAGPINFSAGNPPGVANSAIVSFQRAAALFSHTATFGSYDFESAVASVRQSVNNVGGTGEIYNFQPATRAPLTTAEAQRRAQIDAGRAAGSGVPYQGSGNTPKIRAGYRFSLVDPGGLFDGEYVATRVTHLALTDEQGQHLYGNRFAAMPSATLFVPPRKTPLPRVRGPVTAVVVGVSGEEWYTDQYGRLKVQFFFDRYGSNDETSSAWIRVAAPVGRLGEKYSGADSFIDNRVPSVAYPHQGQNEEPGNFAANISRIGQEVLVQFLDGDPSLPVITGSLYNGVNIPPLALPAAIFPYKGLPRDESPW